MSGKMSEVKSEKWRGKSPHRLTQKSTHLSGILSCLKQVSDWNQQLVAMNVWKKSWSDQNKSFNQDLNFWSPRYYSRHLSLQCMEVNIFSQYICHYFLHQPVILNKTKNHIFIFYYVHGQIIDAPWGYICTK